MSLALREDLYNAYCSLCAFTNRKPLQRAKWEEGFNTPVNPNITIEEIVKELDEVKEHA